jgi:uridine monophosphate synthetase
MFQLPDWLVRGSNHAKIVSMNETLPPLEQFALTLFDIGAVQLGKFKLHSGKKSRIYLDLRVLVSFPFALRQAVAAYQTVLGQISFDLLAATPLAGLPLGTALCLDMDKPLIYPRKTAKSYGTGKEIEGVWQVGQTAVIIDDLITSGDSILQAIVALKASGLQVNEAVVLVDREQGGVAMMQEHGYKLHAIMRIGQILSVLEEHERISSKEHAKVLKSLRRA